MSLPPVIFEDEVLIAFNKPGGMLIVPDSQDPARESLLPAIHARYGETIANVHRLEPEASGLFLCAKTKPALDFLSGQFQSKTVRKNFLALVVLLPAERALKSFSALRDASGGLPDTFTIDAPLRADERQRDRMRVFKGRGGKESVTEFEVRERFGRFALVEARPITGRPHQVRVHLSAIGAPVLNDLFYGDPETKLLLSNLKRGYKGDREAERPLIAQLALHSSEISLVHPTSRADLHLTAPLPNEFEIGLKYLRKTLPTNRKPSSV
jgi:23S rRNA pseudouridine1911/1915/1917 synthase